MQECDNDGCYYDECSIDGMKKKSRLSSRNVPVERYQMIVKKILSSHQFISLCVLVYSRLPFVLIAFFFS